MPQAATLKPGQVRHLARVTEATSRNPERDCLILMLGLTAGLRISEIGQIEVADVLFPSGLIRQEASLKANYAKGNKQRLFYLTNRHVIYWLERYIAYRLEHSIGTELTKERFRGLSPETKLILKRNGGNFSLNTKRRINCDGEQVDYRAADSLQSLVTRLMANAGIKSSSHAGRRTFASNLLANGVGIETVQLLLGHSDIQCTYPYLTVDPKKLRQMFAEVL